MIDTWLLRVGELLTAAFVHAFLCHRWCAGGGLPSDVASLKGLRSRGSTVCPEALEDMKRTRRDKIEGT